MAVKARQVCAQVVGAICGKCGEELTTLDGSYQLEPQMVGTLITCQSCGAENQLPKTAKL